jgi:hypothetical protein
VSRPIRAGFCKPSDTPSFWKRGKRLNAAWRRMVGVPGGGC